MVYDEQRAIMQHESDRYAQLMSAFRCVEAKCKELEAELAKRVEPAVTLNAEKMAFMREFVLKRACELTQTVDVSYATECADLAWRRIISACEGKP